jgi:hypothetical protein
MAKTRQFWLILTDFPPLTAVAVALADPLPELSALAVALLTVRPELSMTTDSCLVVFEPSASA